MNTTKLFIVCSRISEFFEKTLNNQYVGILTYDIILIVPLAALLETLLSAKVSVNHCTKSGMVAVPEEYNLVAVCA